MECEKIKKEYPEVKFEPCCESCHEDDAMGYGGDLWFEVKGVDRHICCAVARSLKAK